MVQPHGPIHKLHLVGFTSFEYSIKLARIKSRQILHQHMLAVLGRHHRPMNVQTSRQRSPMGPPLLVRELDPRNRFATEWRTEFGDKLMALVSFLAVFAHPMMPKRTGASVSDIFIWFCCTSNY
ncbi:hypothetical protein V6N13_004313 [Hibiscus sabdariffa]|uniref:Uncharacterized protein n=1 Tax=Hibiscus sabdariffa TaxID=183260 RepID=A0ABR2RYD2_9ROSI